MLSAANPGRHRLLLLAVEEGAGAGALQIIPLEQPRQTRTVPLGLQPHEIAVAPDGRIAYVSNFGLLEANHKIGTPGKSISVIDVVAGREIRKFMLPAPCLAPHGLKLRPPTYQELFVNAEEGQQALVVFAAHSGQLLRQIPIPPSVHNFIFDASGSRLYAFAIDGSVYRIDPEKGTVLAQAKVNSPRGLTWTSDGKELIASGKGELVLLNPNTLAVTRRISELQVGQIFYSKALTDGKTILAPAVLDGVVLVVNLRTGKVEKRIKTDGGPLQVCLDPSGLRAWIANVPLPAKGQSDAVGITELDLQTCATRPIPGFPDVNGIAVTNVSE